MGPIWGWQDPGGSDVGPMNFAIWVKFVPRTDKPALVHVIDCHLSERTYKNLHLTEIPRHWENHYNAVTMGTIASKSPASWWFTQPCIQTQIKENIKAPRHWPLCGEFTGTGEFPAQMASDAENVSIWWRHHSIDKLKLLPARAPRYWFESFR